MSLLTPTRKIAEQLALFQARWIVFNKEKRLMRWLPFILIFILTVFNGIQYVTPQQYREDPWIFVIYALVLIAAFYSTCFYWHDYSSYVILGAFILLMTLTYFIWMLVVILFIYYFYYWLDARRLRKLEKLARTPPAKLAKLSTEKIGPRVEVTVRTGGGGK